MVCKGLEISVILVKDLEIQFFCPFFFVTQSYFALCLSQVTFLCKGVQKSLLLSRDWLFQMCFQYLC